MPSIDGAVALAVLETAGDAIIVADRDGKIRYWNDAASLLFGPTSEEALGQPLDLIIPERLRDRHWEGFRHTMATGETKYAGELLSVPALASDGRTLSVEFTVGLLLDDTGAVAAITAILRDVTARRAQERELRQRLQALEERASGATDGTG